MNNLNFDPRAFQRYSRVVSEENALVAIYRPVPFRIAYAKEINTAVAVFVSIMSAAFVFGVV